MHTVEVPPSQLVVALSALERRQIAEESLFTRFGNWFVAASALLGITATSTAVVLNRPRELVILTAASVLGMIHGVGSWRGARDRQEETAALKEFADNWGKLHGAYHWRNQFLRSIH